MNRNLSPADRAMLRDNLMRISNITTRIGVPVNMIAIWRDRYAGFPEPLVPHNARSVGAIYWWPDIEKFLTDNGLPDPQRRKPGRRLPASQEARTS